MLLLDIDLGTEPFVGGLIIDLYHTILVPYSKPLEEAVVQYLGILHR